jgi:hypothetical protein
MHEELHRKALSDADLRKGINGKAQQLKVIQAKYLSRSSPGPAHSSPREGSGEGAWSGGGRPLRVADPPPTSLCHPFDRRWHGSMQRRWRPGLHAKNSHSTALAPFINGGATPPLQHTSFGFPHTLHSSLVVTLLFSSFRARQSQLGGLGSLEEDTFWV